jgi:hypothetical protein
MCEVREAPSDCAGKAGKRQSDPDHLFKVAEGLIAGRPIDSVPESQLILVLSALGAIYQEYRITGRSKSELDHLEAILSEVNARVKPPLMRSRRPVAKPHGETGSLGSVHSCRCDAHSASFSEGDEYESLCQRVDEICRGSELTEAELEPEQTRKLLYIIKQRRALEIEAANFDSVRVLDSISDVLRGTIRSSPVELRNRIAELRERLDNLIALQDKCEDDRGTEQSNLYLEKSKALTILLE